MDMYFGILLHMLYGLCLIKITSEMALGRSSIVLDMTGFD